VSRARNRLDDELAMVTRAAKRGWVTRDEYDQRAAELLAQSEAYAVARARNRMPAVARARRRGTGR